MLYKNLQKSDIKTQKNTKKTFNKYPNKKLQLNNIQVKSLEERCAAFSLLEGWKLDPNLVARASQVDYNHYVWS